ncbi:Phenazine biosynthesis protein PhzF [Alloactinosynnema sp. L-07]|uniref:PhzF family phenazine biosynthesis protein n=1 Tax=Alloactinosynnema sp. L-07 TaxID=1653480 RepID=UPI00065F0AF3|nr:PhzF family phenazine biosynthesis isomerase [Alloactinosynnema sp. L-07]CRK58744.1 Phenazine biosynthesis protein PhzF [Alloactinosynnema sp. L-07]
MYEYAIADVFTDVALQGNPVAVFLDARGLETDRMQCIAREMNLSETTFVLPPTNGGDVRVRIFTPVNELPFAGHPTLGTAVVLGQTRSGPGLAMETAMGTIPFDYHRAGGRVTAARMRQPVPTWEPYPQTEHLLAALGLATSTLPVEVYRNGPRHVYIGLPTIDALSALTPDQRALAAHVDVAANCFAGAGANWRMRMFSPAYGVAEDAATGSAAGPLAIHLARHGLAEWGEEIEILQGVEMGRRSAMYATAIGNAQRIERVEVAGSVVVVAEGTLRL